MPGFKFNQRRLPRPAPPRETGPLGLTRDNAELVAGLEPIREGLLGIANRFIDKAGAAIVEEKRRKERDQTRLQVATVAGQFNRGVQAASANIAESQTPVEDAERAVEELEKLGDDAPNNPRVREFLAEHLPPVEERLRHRGGEAARARDVQTFSNEVTAALDVVTAENLPEVRDGLVVGLRALYDEDDPRFATELRSLNETLTVRSLRRGMESNLIDERAQTAELILFGDATLGNAEVESTLKREARGVLRSLYLEDAKIVLDDATRFNDGDLERLDLALATKSDFLEDYRATFAAQKEALELGGFLTRTEVRQIETGFDEAHSLLVDRYDRLMLGRAIHRGEQPSGGVNDAASIAAAELYAQTYMRQLQRDPNLTRAQRNRAVGEFVGRFGFAPEPVQAHVQRLFGTGRQTDLLEAADLVEMTIDSNRRTGISAIAGAQREGLNRIAGGLSPEQIAFSQSLDELIEAGVEPAAAIDRARYWTLDEDQHNRMRDRFQRLKQSRSAGGIELDRELRKFALSELSNPSEGVVDDFEREVEFQFAHNNGDLSRAKAAGLAAVNARWHRSKVAGGGWLMQSPERFYGTGRPGDVDWMNRQLSFDLRPLFREAINAGEERFLESLRLVPVESRSDGRPSYMLIQVQTDGAEVLLRHPEDAEDAEVRNLPVIWRPNYARGHGRGEPGFGRRIQTETLLDAEEAKHRGGGPTQGDLELDALDTRSDGERLVDEIDAQFRTIRGRIEQRRKGQ